MWRQINISGLRDKEYINTSKELVLNLKALAFNKIVDVEKRYKNIKKKYGGEDQPVYKKFLESYFEPNWLNDKIIEVKDWNYSEYIILKK